MSDFQEFMANLPWHMKPENDREQLIMQYAWHSGHNTGIRDGIAKLNETLLRLVPLSARRRS